MSNLITNDFTASIDGPSIAGRRKIIQQCNRARSVQQVAATLAADPCVNGLVLQPGTVREVYVQMSAACAAGESMVFDVLKNGASILSATLTVNSTNGTARATISASLSGTPTVVAGDLLTVSRTYVAGGGPTMTVTAAVIEYSAD